MPFIYKIIVTFAFILMISAGAVVLFNKELGYANFWDYHGIFFLIFITCFPRLTLLFSSVPFGGVLWWAGLFFFPRYLVAILATLTYWHQNKLLVIISWLVALGGESSEKAYIHKKARPASGVVIDAEYKVHH